MLSSYPRSYTNSNTWIASASTSPLSSPPSIPIMFYSSRFSRKLVLFVVWMAIMVVTAIGKESTLRLHIYDADTHQRIAARVYLNDSAGKARFLESSDPEGKAVRYENRIGLMPSRSSITRLCRLIRACPKYPRAISTDRRKWQVLPKLDPRSCGRSTHGRSRSIASTME